MSVASHEPNEQPLPPLQRLAADRARENELGQSESSIRVQSAAFGFFVGGFLGLFIGHMGLLTLEAYEEFLLTYYWTRELINFDNQLPLIPTYFLGGGLVGALVSYHFFILRSPIPSLRSLVVGTVIFALGTVFLIGYLASLMIVNFLDPIPGPSLGYGEPNGVLRFTLSLFGAIPSSLGVMGGAYYVGFLSTGIFVMLWAGTKTALERTSHISPLAGRIPFATVIYITTAVLALIPYAISILSPESTINQLVSLLSSLET